MLNCNRSYVLHGLQMTHGNTNLTLVFFVRSGHIFFQTLEDHEGHEKYGWESIFYVKTCLVLREKVCYNLKNSNESGKWSGVNAENKL